MDCGLLILVTIPFSTPEYPFLTSFVIMLMAFALGHILPVQAYKAGKTATIIAGFIFAALALALFYFALSASLILWQGILGLGAGISFWIFYGEILETLQADFGVNTGVHISYSNWPVLIVLGGLLGINWSLYPQSIFAVDSFIVAFYGTWLFHVVLLTVYYAPVFGGEIVGKGVKNPAVKVWSKTRIMAAAIIALIYVLLIIGLVQNMLNDLVRIIAGFLVIIMLWSVVMEIPKKLFSGFSRRQQNGT